MNNKMKYIEMKRKEYGLTQEELVIDVCDSKNYGKMLRGSRVANARHISGICERLSINQKDLEIYDKYASLGKSLLIVDLVEELFVLAKKQDIKRLELLVNEFERNYNYLINDVDDIETQQILLFCKATIEFNLAKYQYAVEICIKSIKLRYYDFQLHQPHMTKTGLLTGIEIECLLLICLCYLKLNDVDSCMAVCEDINNSLQSKIIKNRDIVIKTLYVSSLACELKKDYEKANDYIKKAINYYNRFCIDSYINLKNQKEKIGMFC